MIVLSAPSILANINEINSDDILRFIIFLSPVSCDGSDRLLYRRLFLPTMFPMTYALNKHFLASLSRKPAENAERFAESLNDINYINISAFIACFAFGFLYTVLVRTE